MYNLYSYKIYPKDALLTKVRMILIMTELTVKKRKASSQMVEEEEQEEV